MHTWVPRFSFSKRPWFIKALVAFSAPSLLWGIWHMWFPKGGPSPATNRPPPGSHRAPLVLGIVPSAVATASASAAETKRLRHCLESKTHLRFQIRVATHNGALVEAMHGGHVHGALLSSYAFFLAHRQGARAILRLVRDGSSSYYGQIVVRAGGAIRNLSDLQGKIVATVDPTSTSSLYGLKLLRDKGVTPRQIWVAHTHMAALTAVYQNPPVAHGAAVYHHPGGRDARRLLKTQFPDVFEALTPLATVGPIPNEPFVVSAHFPREHISLFQGALRTCSWENPEILGALSNSEGFEIANDSDYAQFFQTVQEMAPTTP